MEGINDRVSRVKLADLDFDDVNYIFGGNSKNEQIPMTSPVVIKPYKNNEMAFLMPKNYTMTSLPIPNSDEIKISKTNI